MKNLIKLFIILFLVGCCKNRPAAAISTETIRDNDSPNSTIVIYSSGVSISEVMQTLRDSCPTGKQFSIDYFNRWVDERRQVYYHLIAECE